VTLKYQLNERKGLRRWWDRVVWSYGSKQLEKTGGIEMRKIAFAGPWIGEFGWEIMTWQSYLRKLSHDYDKMIISTFEGMEPLYDGFHCETEFLPHKHPGRALDWRDVSMVNTGFDRTAYTCPVDDIVPIKQFKVEGEFIRYGTPIETDIELLFHARGIQKANFKNYPHEKWDELAGSFPKAASVGIGDDYHVPGTVDMRGIPLQDLMDLMASVQVCVGQSSGVMHLATLCGLKQVVWGDNKTHFSETLENRYKMIWNPFKTPVTWIPADNWDPESSDILKGILHDSQDARPSPAGLNHLQKAVGSGRYLLAVAYIDETDGKLTIESYVETVEVPDDKLTEVIAQVEKDMLTLSGKINMAIAGKGAGNHWG